MQLKVEFDNDNTNSDYQSLLIKLGVPKYLLALGNLDFALLYQRLRFAMSKIHVKNPLECTDYWQLETLGREDFSIYWLKDIASLRDKNGATPCHYLAWSGNLKKLIEIKTYFPNFWRLEDNQGRNLLDYAAMSGNTEVIEWINDNYADAILQKDKHGFTLIHYATMSGDTKTLTWLNTNLSHSLTLKDSRGSTPIHFAARSGDLDTWLWIEVNIPNLSQLKNHIGLSPIHFALMSGNLAILKRIKKEDLILKDNIGRTPLHFAVLSGNPEILDWIKSTMPEAFMMKGKDGATLFHYAALSGNPDAIKWISKNFPKAFDFSDKNKKNPYFYIALSDNIDALNQFLSKKTISLKGFKNFSLGDRKIIIKNLIHALELNYHVISVDNLANCEMANEDKKSINSILRRNNKINQAKFLFISFLQGLQQSNSAVFALNLGDGVCNHILKYVLPENVNFEQINDDIQSKINVKTRVLARIEKEIRLHDPIGNKKEALKNLQDIIHRSENLRLDFANWEQANLAIISKKDKSVESFFTINLININKALTDIKNILGLNTDIKLLKTPKVSGN